MRISKYFSTFGEKQIISITGCGGKTSLLWLLAKHSRAKKVLVSTTTHIHKPDESLHTYDHFLEWGESPPRCEARGASTLPPLRYALNVANGITLALAVNPQASNLPHKSGHQQKKYHSLPLDILEEIIYRFDISLLEADGSRSKPLKAWASYEPVITKSTTITVGILPINVIGKKIDASKIHRLPLWLQLTDANENGIISKQHITRTIYSENGKSLFSAAVGKKILLFNQADKTDNSTETAKEIISLLPSSFLKTLDGVICGSVMQDECVPISENS
ncbi:MAG: selenium cofactor biosynthesis protein YqeC [Termitinemataceae bacterium]|nr:MAG: selenium cofactor biosynthesis protein YqeC [Termitinemataceae bacterium]